MFKFPNGPFVLGLLLGSMLESNMRRALVMSHGSWATFVTRPVSCVLFIAIVLTFCWPVLKAAMAKKKAAARRSNVLLFVCGLPCCGEPADGCLKGAICMDALSVIKDHGIIPVLGLKDPETAPQVAAALRAGDCPCWR